MVFHYTVTSMFFLTTTHAQCISKLPLKVTPQGPGIIAMNNE